MLWNWTLIPRSSSTWLESELRTKLNSLARSQFWPLSSVSNFIKLIPVLLEMAHIVGQRQRKYEVCVCVCVCVAHVISALASQCNPLSLNFDNMAATLWCYDFLLFQLSLLLLTPTYLHFLALSLTSHFIISYYICHMSGQLNTSEGRLIWNPIESPSQSIDLLSPWR